MIRVIIFDLGGVLIEIDYHEFINNVSKEFNIPVLELIKNSTNEAHNDYMMGKITGEKFYEIVCKKYDHSISIEKFKKLWASILVKQNDEVANIVINLKKRYQLAIMSNTDPWHFSYCLKKYPVIEIFKKRFLSYEEQMLKPDPQFFKLVADLLNVHPTSCLLIDDLTENVQSAEKVGYQVIQFRDVYNLKNELEKLGIKIFS